MPWRQLSRHGQSAKKGDVRRWTARRVRRSMSRQSRTQRVGLCVRDARRATVARRAFPVRTALLAFGATVAVPTAGCTGHADPPASSTPQNSVAEHADRSDELLARFPPNEPGCSAAVGIEGEVVWAGV